jgi:predicted nucleotidyltransferase
MNYKLIAYAGDFVSYLLSRLPTNIVETINQVILFGSVSRGEENKTSDMDIFIDFSNYSSKIEAQINLAKEEFYQSVLFKKYWDLMGIRNEISLTMGKIEEWTELKRSIIANGITLYGKYLGKNENEPFSLFILTQSKTRNKNISIWRKLYGYKQKINKKVYVHEGMISQFNGRKLGSGLFVVPNIHAPKIINLLKNSGLKYQIQQIWQEK